MKVVVISVFFYAITNASEYRDGTIRQRNIAGTSHKLTKRAVGIVSVTKCKTTTLGKEYKGVMSITKSGRTCQRWDVQFPHTHKMKTHNEENYCRNPDDSPEGPWCYTIDASTRWEYCPIHYCDPCENLPCMNMETCKRNGIGYEFTCTCVPGYTGIHCQTEINECASSPCLHGSECADLINEYRCHCSEGYTDTNCQIDINDCAPNPCVNNGTCIDLVHGYRCFCIKGYEGTNCQFDRNECERNPCLNNATCVDGIASWDCKCLPGYMGARCETEINECNSNPCQNNGTCIDLLNRFECQCPNDTKGDFCEIWIDHCHSTPCLHGGVCSNHYDRISCNCLHPWKGKICEYQHINRTDGCMFLDYTECSCQISLLKDQVRTSYEILTGVVGTLLGLISTMFTYAMWLLLNRAKISNTIKPENKETKYFPPDKDCEIDNKCTMRNESESITPVSPQHCNCFVDHSGYDHFQRYVEKNNRFKFHKCQHKKVSRLI